MESTSSEITAFLAMVGLIATVYIGGYLGHQFPSSWGFLLKAPALPAFIWVSLGGIALSRLVLCVFVYSKPFTPLQWTISIICVIFFLGWHTHLAQNAQAAPLGDFMTLESSDFDLTITCDGHAKMKRNQILIPNKDLKDIKELDFYSSGNTRASDFQIEIFEHFDNEPGEQIPSEIVEFREMSKFVNKMKGARRLHRGRQYLRRTTLTARDAYKDKVGDAFIIVVNHKTKSMECSISFEGGCTINRETFRFVMMKEAGVVLDKPKRLPIEHVHKDQVKVFVYNPKIADQYGLFWDYIIPPSEGN